jgi:hypothetical protein
MTAAPVSTQNAAQLEANKKIVRDFLRPGATPMERYNLLHDEFIERSAPSRKVADEAKLSYKESFLKTATAAAARQGGAGGGGRGAGPTPPVSTMPDMYIAEGDLVSVVRERFQQDPTAPPGTWYAYYWQDTWRIKDGKLYERWNTLTMSAPTGGRGQGQD